MTTPHYMLIIWWVLYYIFHSVLASLTVKRYFQKIWGKAYRYYRLSYSILVTIGLIFILWYQYSFASPRLIRSVVLQSLAFLLMVIPGSIIMFISVKKYFTLLSGIRSIYQPVPPVALKVEGIHRFVRHPLYSGTILLVWGLFFIFPLLNNLIAVVLLTLYVWIGIYLEEKKLLIEFGKDYGDYMLKVPKLIPKFKK